MVLDPFAAVDGVRDWLLSASSHGGGPERIFGALAEQLLAVGFPMWRMSTGLHTLNPKYLAAHVIWIRGQEAHIVHHNHAIVSTPTYQGTPVEAVVQGTDRIRCRLDVPPAELQYPVLAELAALGGTDYLILALDSSESLSADSASPYWKRQWVSFTTDVPGGFPPEQLAALERLVPVLALRLTLETSKHAGRSLLRAYLGQNASRRILAGAFQRGTAEAIRAVIWYCDMRGFTTLSDTRPARDVVRILDSYFDCVASPVDEHGGEVLKFIGDAVLAVFPIDDGGARDPCARALAAVHDARANLAQLNGERGQQGEPPLGLGIALHTGEVMYGNIGARSRLDFTVIGAPVNEVCRVEALTRTLGVDVLLTAAFVRAAELTDATSLGRHALKGVAEPQEVFTLP